MKSHLLGEQDAAHVAAAVAGLTSPMSDARWLSQALSVKIGQRTALQYVYGDGHHVMATNGKLLLAMTSHATGYFNSRLVPVPKAEMSDTYPDMARSMLVQPQGSPIRVRLIDLVPKNLSCPAVVVKLPEIDFLVYLSDWLKIAAGADDPANELAVYPGERRVYAQVSSRRIAVIPKFVL